MFCVFPKAIPHFCVFAARFAYITKKILFFNKKLLQNRAGCVIITKHVGCGEYGSVVQLVRTPPCHGGGRGFESHPNRHFFDRSICSRQTSLCGFSSFGRAPPCQGGGSGFEPRNPLHIRRHSQAVRQRSAKPLFPSSILGGASRKPDAFASGFQLNPSLRTG